MKFPETSKDYYVVVNYPELAERAKELGYEGVMIRKKAAFSSHELSELKKRQKSVMCLMYHPDISVDDDGANYTINNSDYAVVTWELRGRAIDEQRTIETLQDAVQFFPKPKKVESYLFSRGYIHSADYENRCGNCSAYLSSEDKHCQNCGTKKGEGSFLPYKNIIEILYGPPITKKYKCESCNHVWITLATGGRDDCHYCPQCGCGSPLLLGETVRSFIESIGTENAFEEKDRPLLFSDEQISRLLALRTAFDAEANREKETFRCMREAGVELPEQMHDEDWEKYFYPITEKDDEQLILANAILHAAGTQPQGIPGVCCPHCKNNIIAAISYTVLGDDYKEIKTDFHVPVPADALVLQEHRNWFLGCEKQTDGSPLFSYACLRCGKRFGNFSRDSIAGLKKAGSNAEMNVDEEGG